MSEKPLVLQFLGSLIEELGAQLYPSVTASVAELVSNAWDADATNVWITVPFGASTIDNHDLEITVLDDGIGMAREEAQLKYLRVGRKRRVEERTYTTQSGRPLHGRKGIGKLSAFGTARYLECITQKKSHPIASFILDYDEIRGLGPGQDYQVPETETP